MFEALSVSESTTLYRHGTPFHTDAIVLPISTDKSNEAKRLPYKISAKCKKRTTILTLHLAPEDRVYGLGENLGSLNRRGKRYRLYAKDEPDQNPSKQSLYSSHPFVIIQGSQNFGLFIDFPGEIVFDVGFTEIDTLSIEIASADFDLYIFNSQQPLAIIKSYLQLTGCPYFPPRWSFGYQQCRYSYPDEKTVREICDNLEKHQIKCNAIYIDIDYMVGYKIFSVHPERFPDLPKLVADLKDKDIRVIPIIDPGVKIEPGYLPYDSGLEKKVFCQNKDGTPFVGAVWPGLVHFPDFLNKKCRAWWGSLYREFCEMGIEGIWNDMSEPSVFFTPNGVKKMRRFVRKKAPALEQGEDPIGFITNIGRFWGNEEYYTEFYHQTDEGNVVNHRDVHNLYGFNMARATSDGLLANIPDKRYFLVTRSSYAGMHRFAVIWTGDNSSWWEHMAENIQMLMSLNMAGFFFVGADVGGFGGDTSPELLIRWTQLGLFNPLFRNHSTKGSRDQEPWRFGEKVCSIVKNIIDLRYSLIPYIYSEYLYSLRSLKPLIRPLFFDFTGDKTAPEIEDQFMLGQSIMAAPVYKQGAKGRFVHLPECRWALWLANDWKNRNLKVYSPGDYFVECPLDSTPIFLRENHLLPLCNPDESADPQTLYVTGLITDEASLTLFSDDGITFEYQNDQVSSVTLTAKKTRDGFEVSVTPNIHPSIPIKLEKVVFDICDENGTMTTIEKSLSS